ncbi:WxL domain-containing protein [Vagococcus fluvialis]|uniref:WxL domain-containing protein n=1 Tax=Vagococcus fluvialis TaxID=2738 RepID=A0A7X6DAC2_9ENTE|nr:WxL domain-containing protein [Vagococcus fluvialis]NKC68418.1 WxL domain-containing protein [Vagococcus fluvialis]
MKNKFLVTLALPLAIALLPVTSYSETSGFETNGNVTVTPSDKTDPLDPENPLEPVDPGEGPSTDGELRIDFVSTINFADAKITKNNRVYPSLAQLFHSDTPARASYIQITDLRKDNPGWNLQLKQEIQFKNIDNIELSGARLSFDKGWASSGGIGKSPILFRDAISIDEIGSSYEIATAPKGAGQGTWLLSFGSSSDNKVGQEVTLNELKDEDGKTMVDPIFKKNMYSNSAVSLAIPEKTTIVPGRYQTELTWILQATP